MRERDRDPKAKPRPGDENYVGRGYPPEHGRIKPGEVRNPNGRKGKKRAEAEQDFAGQMARLIAQPIRAKDGQTYAPPEVILSGLLKGVSAGDTRAVKLYVELCERYMPSSSGAEEHEVSANIRQRAIEDALARVAAKRADGRSASPQISGEALDANDGGGSE